MIGISPKELAFGVLAGKILASALLASSLFRNVGLAAAASAIVFTYAQDGIAGMLKLGITLSRDAAAHPDFTYGIALGTLASTIALLIFRRRRSV